MTLNSLFTTEVWVRSRDSAGLRVKDPEGRPTFRYMLTVLLWDGGMARSPEVARLIRLEDTDIRRESPKIFR